MHGAEAASETGGDAQAIRLQAEEHPLIEDVPPANAAEHCLRLMHLRAYDEAVGYAEGRDVLDVGCNTGYGTVRLTRVAHRVVGTDVSPRAIEAARTRAVDGQPEFVLTDGFALPFPDATFDLVTSFQVLEHVPDPLPYLRGLRRVLRAGGVVVLATPNASTRLDPGMTPWNRFHVREYRADELGELLGRVFGDVRVRGMFGTPTLYETEIRRVDAARQRLRRIAEAERRKARASGDAAGSAKRANPPERPLARRVARALLPSIARSWIRSAVAPVPRPAPATTESPRPLDSSPTPGTSDAPMDFDRFLRFSVDDLFYADHDLDRAMDLLAICRT